MTTSTLVGCLIYTKNLIIYSQEIKYLIKIPNIIFHIREKNQFACKIVHMQI